MGEEYCETLRIRVLVENTATDPALAACHGLAYWIETPAHRVLFDTGPDETIVANSRKMGVDLSSADAIVLSHGHYDHAGGLEAVLGIVRDVPVWLIREALAPKFKREKDGTAKRVSTPFVDSGRLEKSGCRLVFMEEPAEVVPGVRATGPIPRRTLYEDVGGPFFLDESLGQPDPLTDDQALVLNAKNGFVVLLGCAHAGVVNTLDFIDSWPRRREVAALIGGMHLLMADEQRLEKTCERLAAAIPLLAPCHCTGAKPMEIMRGRFGARCVACGAGSEFLF
jgi:7,8-dihydropterin-6-yl-methyl-4-(beta-D-ribofuranosyl)aminobenzene 5'-phosphate synthase